MYVYIRLLKLPERAPLVRYKRVWSTTARDCPLTA